MPAHLPFPNMESAAQCLNDFKYQGAVVMPEMGRFCADRLRVEAKEIRVCQSLIVIGIVREVDFLYVFHVVGFSSSCNLAGFR